MNKIKCLFLLICFISCEKSKENNPEILLIFKNNEITDTVFYDKNYYGIIEDPITYRIKDNFIDFKLNVLKENDTFKIKTKKPIILKHNYYHNDYYSSIYYFEPNDTVVFFYKNGIPYVENSNSKNYNFNVLFNLKNPTNSDENLFYLINNRFKNKFEKKADSLKYIEIKQKKHNYFNELSSKKLIDTNNYLINIYNSNNDYILLENIKLYSFIHTDKLITTFENIYKPNLLHFSTGVIPDYCYQFDRLFELENSVINQNNKKYLLFYYLDKIAKFFPCEQLKSRFYKLCKFNTDNRINNYFIENYSLCFVTKNNVKNNDILLQDQEGNATTLSKILKDNNGKLIFIDFWASWCAPCIENFKIIEPLQRKVINEPIKFINISIDRDIKKWKNYVAKNKNSFSENYIALDYPNNKFYKEINLKTIPRYLIYNRVGKLIDKDAFLPVNETYFSDYLLKN